MATDASDAATDDEPFYPPTTRFISANGNLVRYDFDAPEPPEQRVVAVESDHAHVAVRIDEGADADALAGVLDDLATEFGFAAGEDVDP